MTFEELKLGDRFRLNHMTWTKKHNGDFAYGLLDMKHRAMPNSPTVNWARISADREVELINRKGDK